MGLNQGCGCSLAMSEIYPSYLYQKNIQDPTLFKLDGKSRDGWVIKTVKAPCVP